MTLDKLTSNTCLSWISSTNTDGEQCFSVVDATAHRLKIKMLRKCTVKKNLIAQGEIEVFFFYSRDNSCYCSIYVGDIDKVESKYNRTNPRRVEGRKITTILCRHSCWRCRVE